MSQFYVYVIFRPTGVPCYVGKGKGRRLQQHARHTHNIHLKRIFSQAGGCLPSAVIRDGLTNEAACEIERALIAALGRDDLRTGPLVNLSDGGEGPAGAIRSAEYRARIGNAFRGKKLSAEQIAHRSETQRGHAVSAETRAKISAGNSGKRRSPEVVEQIRARLMGATQSPETITKRKATFYANGVRDKISAANLGRHHTAEARERIRVAATGRVVTPETKEKISQARRRTVLKKNPLPLFLAADLML